VTNTQAEWLAAKQITDTAGGTVVDWWTKQLAAFTLSGGVRCNIRGLESNGSASAVIRVELAVCNSDGSSPVVWSSWTHYLELGLSEAAVSILPEAPMSRSLTVSACDPPFHRRLHQQRGRHVSQVYRDNVLRRTTGGASGDRIWCSPRR
jgi:hypothetical protein